MVLVFHYLFGQNLKYCSEIHDAFPKMDNPKKTMTSFFSFFTVNLFLSVDGRRK